MTERLCGIKVLVIEPSKEVGEATTLCLQNLGMTAVLVADAYEALSLVVDKQPDLILLEVNSPRLGGYECCALLKSNQAYRHIPIVLCADSESLLERQKVSTVCADGVLHKPLTQEAVRRCFNEVLAQNEVFS